MFRFGAQAPASILCTCIFLWNLEGRIEYFWIPSQKLPPKAAGGYHNHRLGSTPVNDSGGLGWSLIIYISKKLPGDADTAGPGITLSCCCLLKTSQEWIVQRAGNKIIKVPEKEGGILQRVTAAAMSTSPGQWQMVAPNMGEWKEKETQEKVEDLGQNNGNNL